MTRHTYIVEMKENDLAVILVSALCNTSIPEDKTSAEMLAELPDDCRADAIRQARAAIVYFKARLANLSRQQ